MNIGGIEDKPTKRWFASSILLSSTVVAMVSASKWWEKRNIIINQVFLVLYIAHADRDALQIF